MINFLKSGEKKKLLAELDKIYGISRLNYILIRTGQDKIRGFSGSMNREEIEELADIANLEIIGGYIFKEEKGGLRLSLDASHVLGEEATKSVLEVSEEQFTSWLKGNDLDIEREKGIVLIRHASDFAGCGISDGKKIINFVPKERRIRFSSEK